MKYILLLLLVTVSYSQVWVRGSKGMIKLAGQTETGDSVTIAASASVQLQVGSEIAASAITIRNGSFVMYQTY